MNKKHYLLGLATLTIVGYFATPNFKSEKEYYQPRVEEEAQSPNGYFEYLHSLRANQITDKVDPADIAAVKAEMASAKLHKGQFPIKWESVGPDNIGGRTRAIHIDINDNNILYAGGVSGGLFKSINKGASWYPVNDLADNLNVCAISQTPDGTLYYGTGESFATGGGSEFGTPGFPGNGIYKSTDGGETFTHLPATSGYVYTNKLLGHPTKNIIFAATNSGMRFSEDGGETWKLGRAGNCRDMAMDKNGNMLVYNANRIYRSDNPTDANSYVAVTGISSTGRRVGLAYSLSDPNYAYVVVVSNGVVVNGTTLNDALLGIWQSKDNGATFSQIVGQANQYFQPFSRIATGGQGNYDLAIGVHPLNRERVFIGGIGFAEWSAEEGPRMVGNTSHDPSNPFAIHADKHFITFDTKSNPPIMYIGHDGGISKTTNANLDRYAPIDNGYQTTQFYGIAASRDGKVVGGTQDNSTILIDGLGSTKEAGYEILGGDGFKCEISQKNNDIFFVCSQYGRMGRTLNGGGNPANIWDDRITPEFVNATTPNNIFNTPLRLWEGDSMDDNNFFFALNSSIWMARNATNNPTPTWFKVAESGFAAHTMEVSPDGDNLYVAALSGSRIFRLSGIRKANFDTSELVAADAISDSLTWTNIRGNLPSRTITDIEVDVNNPNTVIVTFGNYGNTAYIYRTDNALDDNPTWTSIQGALPRFPVYDVEINVENRDEIIVGTEYGIWATQNGTSATPTWTEHNNGFPRVPVFQMRQVEISEKDQNGNIVWRTGPTLYAGTHGRGIFKTSNFLTSAPKTKVKTIGLDVYPNPAKTEISLSLSNNIKGAYNYQVLDLQGRVIKSGTQNSFSNETISIEELKMGTYIITISGEDYKASTKFIKWN